MKKNGFTLVELLAVIILLALLMVIAVPNAFKMASKVKGRAYDTKIELIEKAGIEFGQSNLSLVRHGTSLTNSNEHHTCTFNFNNKNITSVTYNTKNYSDSTSLLNEANRKEYWCVKATIADLVKSNNLSWDYTNQCDGKCSTDEEKRNYDEVVIDPDTNYIINKCNIYVYYRNNRVYAYFDSDACKKQSDFPNSSGNQYRPIKK